MALIATYTLIVIALPLAILDIVARICEAIEGMHRHE